MTMTHGTDLVRCARWCVSVTRYSSARYAFLGRMGRMGRMFLNSISAVVRSVVDDLDDRRFQLTRQLRQQSGKKCRLFEIGGRSGGARRPDPTDARLGGSKDCDLAVGLEYRQTAPFDLRKKRQFPPFLFAGTRNMWRRIGQIGLSDRAMHRFSLGDHRFGASSLLFYTNEDRDVIPATASALGRSIRVLSKQASGARCAGIGAGSNARSAHGFGFSRFAWRRSWPLTCCSSNRRRRTRS